MIYDSETDLAHSRDGFIEHGLGAYVRSLSYDEALLREPGLRHRKPFAGALFTPDDETGDCAAFVRGLERILKARRAVIRKGQGVRTLVRRAGRLQGVEMEGGERLEADIFVLTAGIHAPALLRKAGLAAPVYPVKGYTYELPYGGKPAPFRASIVDMALKMVLTPLDAALKVSNGIFFEPMGRRDDERFLRHVQKAASGLYPDIDFTGATLRSGYRPWTPDSLPIVEKRLDNLYLNIGHGMLGWTMAHGTAKRLADIVKRKGRAA